MTFDADGHGAVATLNPCVLGALVDYLNEGILPAKDSVCVQQGEPFPAPGVRAIERPEWKPAEPLFRANGAEIVSSGRRLAAA